MNPDNGRFETTDPWKGNNHDPLSLNKYLYVHANPVMNSDPSGMFTLQELNIAESINQILKFNNKAKKIKRLHKARRHMCRPLRGTVWHGHHLVPISMRGLQGSWNRHRNVGTGITVQLNPQAHSALHSVLYSVLSITKLIPAGGHSRRAFENAFSQGNIDHVDIMQTLLDVSIWADVACRSVKGYDPLVNPMKRSIRKHGYRIRGCCTVEYPWNPWMSR